MNTRPTLSKTQKHPTPVVCDRVIVHRVIKLSIRAATLVGLVPQSSDWLRNSLSTAGVVREGRRLALPTAGSCPAGKRLAFNGALSQASDSDGSATLFPQREWCGVKRCSTQCVVIGVSLSSFSSSWFVHYIPPGKHPKRIYPWARL